MELTKEQIDALHRFVEKKHVHWYDLQAELVDHLASRIEEDMAANTDLSFDAALEKVYAGFGIFGFAKLVQERQSQLQRRAKRIWWTEFRSYLRWPRIAFLAMVVAVFWQLGSWVQMDALVSIFIAGYLIAGFWMLVLIKREEKAHRKLLLLQFGPVHISGWIIFFEMGILTSIYETNSLVFACCAALGILIRIACYRLYRQVRAEALRLYPEAFV